MYQPDNYRMEEDSLGAVAVPKNALFGAQTQRALDNFRVLERQPWWPFVHALVLVKKCAAKVNRELGLLDPRTSQAIIVAADQVLSGNHQDSFCVDPIQAGAGTSLNMNVNEVLANLATVILGGELGTYLVHPNDHVNMAQSTNDTIPTAIRVGILREQKRFITSLNEMIRLFDEKVMSFDPFLKSGRTHLQDAVPMRLGQAFSAFRDIVRKDRDRVQQAGNALKDLPIGGTAVGTGLNAHPEYSQRMARVLREETGIPFRRAENLFESMQSMADLVAYAGAIRVFAVSMTKIANDLRLLSSGPNTGLAEIRLKAVQPGSSIMPGKVNPVMAEMMNMAMFHVMGNDKTISLASQAGQLELNVMMPIIGHHLFEMVHVATGAVVSFNGRCLRDIEANPERMRFWLEKNPIIITALNPLIGYAAGAAIVKEAEAIGTSVQAVALDMAREGNLTHIITGEKLGEEAIQEALDNLEKLTRGGLIG